MKRLLFIVYLSVVVVSFPYTASAKRNKGFREGFGPVHNSCEFVPERGTANWGVQLWGDVKVNTGGADIQIYLDTAKVYDPDLIIRWTDHPTGCGEWHRVTRDEDFSVTFVDDWEDADLIVQYGNPKEYYYMTYPF
ncbi:MAG: hypothetical protein IJT12_04960 [Paludibacteraceae bacterium]|nr:hypothetical protein [Paludibacteraceae bacterium]